MIPTFSAKKTEVLDTAGHCQGWDVKPGLGDPEPTVFFPICLLPMELLCLRSLPKNRCVGLAQIPSMPTAPHLGTRNEPHAS